jgi:stage V sporulation protein D (sporulation-specific penicillin-binding protein)
MGEVDLATSSFGQGFQITPLQLITAVSATVNGGERMRPTIVKEISNDDGVVKTYQTEVVNRVISEKTSQKMRELLEAVVSDHNATGKNAYVKGYRIGGKTGTSEKQPRGSNKRIASFVGFAPANDPELVCLIMLDEPQTANKFGGTIAAPVCGEIIAESLDYLGVQKQYAEDEEHEKESAVPELRNISVNSAKAKAAEAGFNFKIKGNGDTVIDQLPKPKEVLEEGSIIILYTEERDKNDMAVVPNLKGYSVRDAKYILNNAGLNFEVSGAGHSEAGNAYATSQTFAADTRVLPGTVVGVKFGQQTND